MYVSLECLCWTLNSGCIKCAAKVLPDSEDPDLGTCVKCNIMQCMDNSKTADCPDNDKD